MRETRQKAFIRSADIARVLRRLYVAVSTTSQTSGGHVRAPRRSGFLDLHLCLVSEGYLNESAAGAETAVFPYCYSPPYWSEYKLAQTTSSGTQCDGELETTEGASVPELGAGGQAMRDEHAVEHGSKTAAELSFIATWDVGLLAWRLLQARGGVKRFAHILTFDGFRCAMFDLADAHLTHAQRDVLTPFNGDVKTYLQTYLDFVHKLVETCLAPLDSDGGVSSGYMDLSCKYCSL